MQGGRKRGELAYDTAASDSQLPIPQNAVDLCMNSCKPQSEIRNPKSLHAIVPTLCFLFCALLVALILSAKVAAEEGRQTDAVTIFHCAFGDDWDVNYDAWPDRWVRKTGLGYPQYVRIAIQKEGTAVGAGRCKSISTAHRPPWLARLFVSCRGSATYSKHR